MCRIYSKPHQYSPARWSRHVNTGSEGGGSTDSLQTATTGLIADISEDDDRDGLLACMVAGFESPSLLEGGWVPSAPVVPVVKILMVDDSKSTLKFNVSSNRRQLAVFKHGRS
jgi:hypothetical protein